jgi:hypothetical protein
MKTCPFCAEQIPADAKVCKFCSSTVVRSCPSCAEEVLPTARACRFCGSALPGEAAPPAPRASGGPEGETRGIGMGVLLTVLTCGIYGLVHLYKMGVELNAHQGKNRLNPGVDLLLTVVTCGLWGIWVMYKYPSVLLELSADEGRRPVDVILPCLLLSILGGFLGWIGALAILQNELNQHWESHRTPGA